MQCRLSLPPEFLTKMILDVSPDSSPVDLTFSTPPSLINNGREHEIHIGVTGSRKDNSIHSLLTPSDTFKNLQIFKGRPISLFGEVFFERRR